MLKQYKKPRTLGSKDSGMPTIPEAVNSLILCNTVLPENIVVVFLYIWYDMHYPKIGLENFDQWIILGTEICSYFIKGF
jgi:hypothetical protein